MKGRAINQARQFGQGLLINLAFEFDHGLEFHPILIPAPGIKFGPHARTEGDIAVTSHQAQQVPYLLLPFVVSPPVPLYPLIGNFVAQPVPCAADYLTCQGCKPTSSVSSRYIACSGLSPGFMPPWGNCQESCLIRLPQNTSFFEFSRMMPTFERYPLRSIMRFTRLIRHNRIRFFHILSQIESCHEINKTRIG